MTVKQSSIDVSIVLASRIPASRAAGVVRGFKTGRVIMNTVVLYWDYIYLVGVPLIIGATLAVLGRWSQRGRITVLTIEAAILVLAFSIVYSLQNHRPESYEPAAWAIRILLWLVPFTAQLFLSAKLIGRGYQVLGIVLGPAAYLAAVFVILATTAH